MNTSRMEQLTAEMRTKSAKIRALDAEGFSRSEIANFLKIRYQHVRNVLVNDARVAGGAIANGARKGRATSVGIQPTGVRMGPDGRVVIPASFREALGLKEGDTLLASMEDEGIHLLTIPAAVRKAQAIVRRFVPEGVSLVDELISERRREAEVENQNG